MSRKDTGPAAGRELFAHLLAVDAVLAKAGFPPLSEFWRREAKRFLCSSARRWVVRVGRRGGKGLTFAKLAVVFALFAPLVLPPGELALVAFLSIDRREAASRIRSVRAMLDALAVAYEPRAEELELTGRPVMLRVVTASVRAAVGFSTVLVIADEAARWRDDETNANPAREVLASIGPAGAGQPASRTIVGSSPWSESDHHAELFALGDTEHQRVSSAPTWEANPTISEAQTRALEPNEKVWLREYGAVPSATVSSITSALEYDACVLPGVGRVPPVPGDRHVICYDAGLRNDRTVVIAAKRRLRERPDGGADDVLSVVAVRCLAPGLLKRVTPADVVGAIVEMHRLYDGTVFGDLHYADSIMPQLRELGIAVNEASSSASALTRRVEALGARFAAGTLELPDVPELRKEVLAAVVVAHGGGRLTAKAPEGRGRHDDHLSALLLAADTEISGKLPFADGEVVVRYGETRWDSDSKTLHGGEKRFYRRTATGGLVEREPPFGSGDFARYARHEVANGRWTRAIERWVAAEYGPEFVRPDVDLDALDEQRRGGLTVPIIHT